MKLTKNFNLSEFDCKCGCEMPKEILPNIQKLANQLQVLRTATDQPIRINSAYRCEEHNANINGKTNSKHILGKAADITIDNFIPLEVNSLIEFYISSGDILQGGLGLYNSFNHYDIRRTKARWNNETNK
jgi:uncharacterized protein YcbK (DUF882 family)